MLQAYSSNITVAANTAYPLNNVTVEKGCSVVLSAPGTIQLNKRGLYCVTCDGYNTASAAGTVSTQLAINGVLQPQAIAEYTGSTTAIGDFKFQTLVQVAQDNTKCCCTSPTTLQFINGATAVEDAHINVVVTKLC